jgi:cytoskeletal protein RodZ
MPDPFRQDVGGSLRDARERAGISLRTISANTKISVLALEALERNDVSRLPGGLFTRSFLRAYAREVGLDPDETLKRFLAQYPEAGEDAELRESGSEGLDRPPHSAGGRALRVVAWMLPILAGVAYFTLLRSDVSFTGLVPRGAAETRPSLPEPPLTRPSSVPPVQEPSAPVRDAEPTPAVAEVSAPASADPAPAGSIGETPSATAEPSVGEPPAPVAPADVLSIGLAPTSDCWVSLRANGTPVFSGLMTAGDRREFQLRGEVTLTAGDAAALAFTINGEPGRALGAPGKVATVRFSTSTFRQLLASR